MLQEAIASYKRCEELAPATRNASQNGLLALNYVHPGEQPQVGCIRAAALHAVAA